MLRFCFQETGEIRRQLGKTQGTSEEVMLWACLLITVPVCVIHRVHRKSQECKVILILSCALQPTGER